MLCGDGVCFGDDGNDGRLVLESPEDLEIDIFVESTKCSSMAIAPIRNAIARSSNFRRRNVAIKARRVHDVESRVDMGILGARGAHNLHFLGKGLFEFALQERRHFSQLKVNDVLLQALRIPKGQPDSLAVNFRLQVVWDEIANGWSRYLEDVFVLSLGLLLRWERQGSLEELEKGGFAGILAS